jgi:type VI secretion system protein ImpL
VRNAVERYASDYQSAIDDLYHGFKLTATGAVGMRRVLRALSGGGSPLRDFLDDVAHNTALGLDKESVALLDPLMEVETKYEPVAKLSDPGKPGGPLVAYQDILREALARLDHVPPSAAAQSAFGAGLAPLGRLAFDSLSDPKTSPREGARAWAQAQRLDDELARPFLAPLTRLGEQANGDLGRSLVALNRTLVRLLDTELLSRYPFNPQASEEVDPDELDGWLNPKRGRVVRDILSAVAPLLRRNSQYDGSRAWGPSTICADDPACSKGLAPLLATVNDLAHLTALLWTEDGKTQPLRLRVLPHPLQAAGAGPRPVAVRLVVGEGHVDYFNQKPAETVLELDWTKRQTATLSVDLASKDPVKAFEPPAVVVSGTPWSFLRLLQRGQRAGATRTWHIPAGETERVAVSLTVRENATDAFRIGAGALRRLGSAEN